MLMEPQELKYEEEDHANPEVVLTFPEQGQPVLLPAKRLLETAVAALKNPSTDIFYRQQCWELIRSFLMVSFTWDSDPAVIFKILSHPR